MAPKGGAQKGGVEKGGEPKISRFFFPFLPQKWFFSLWVLSWNFGGVLKRRSNVHVRSSLVWSPGGPVWWGRRGFTRHRRTQRGHLRPPVTKIQQEDPQRGKKRTNFPAGEGKKRAKFWAVRERAVTRAPHPEQRQNHKLEWPKTGFSGPGQSRSGLSRSWPVVFLTL